METLQWSKQHKATMVTASYSIVKGTVTTIANTKSIVTEIAINWQLATTVMAMLTASGNSSDMKEVAKVVPTRAVAAA